MIPRREFSHRDLDQPPPFLVHAWHDLHVRRNSIMVSSDEKEHFARVKGSIQEELGRDLKQGEAVEIMADLASEHMQSCNSSIPREYRE